MIPREFQTFQCVILPGALVMASVAAEEFEMTRQTIDGGGVMRSTDGELELSGTIGQPDASAISSFDREFELSGGFWFPLSLDDCDSDGGVDLVDYDDFDGCLSGPGIGFSLPECNCFDVDSDNDVDLSDVARFQSAFTGEWN